jgi:hypothetical protein
VQVRLKPDTTRRSIAPARATVIAIIERSRKKPGAIARAGLHVNCELDLSTGYWNVYLKLSIIT